MVVDVIIGAQGGDEGKGLISAFLSLNGDYSVIVRDCSPQAGHSNIINEKRVGLAHLPAGVINPKMRLLLGGGSLISVEKLLKEIEETGMNPEMLGIDPRATIVTKEHQLEERANENLMKGSGSVGTGAGIARKDKLMRSPKVIFAKHIFELQEYLVDTREEIYKTICRGEKVLLEGDHGAKLDLTWGDWNVVTSKNTNACQFLSDCFIGPKYVRDVIMVMKPYTTMVAQSGIQKLEKIIDDDALVDWAHSSGGEIGTVSKRSRNLGEIEWDKLRQVVKYNGVTEIAITHMDFPRFNGATEDKLTKEAKEFLEEVKKRLCSGFYFSPVIGILSFGQKVEDVAYYKEWKYASMDSAR